MKIVRNWPEGLFIVFVMVLPLTFVLTIRPLTFFALLGRLLISMAAGFGCWLVIILIASKVHDRKKS